MIGSAPDRTLKHYRIAGGIDLFVYPTSKFKTSLLSVLLHRPLDDDSSAAALVPYLLRRGCRGHPDMVSISRRLEELFGASMDVEVLRFGERQILSFRLDVVEDRYLFMGGSALLRKGLSLLRDMMLDPVLEGGCFREEVLVQERTNLLRFVEGIGNDKGRYAFDRTVRRMCEGEPYARFEYGEAEEIAGITPESATRTWRSILASAPIEIYAVGSTPPRAVRDLVAEQFGGLRDPRGVRPPPRAVRRPAGRIRRWTEHEEISQARLVMGYRTEVGYDHPLSVPLVVWNSLFGGGQSSRLFNEVRERHSLAYYCSSSVDRAKGVAFVQAGIDGDRADRVERIVRRQKSEIDRGRIELEELRAAKAALKAGLLSITDHPSRIAGFFQERRAAGASQTVDELLARISRVRRADVSRAGRTVRADAVYLLAGASA